jgi:hypothetical protein
LLKSGAPPPSHRSFSFRNLLQQLVFSGGSLSSEFIMAAARLAVPHGRVLVSWQLIEREECFLVFRLKEEDGPAVSLPSKEGFGLFLIRSIIAREPRLSFEERGSELTLEVPLSEVQQTASRRRKRPMCKWINGRYRS